MTRFPSVATSLCASVFGLFIASALAATPYWDNGSGANYAPVAWPSEPSDPLQCGDSCGDWIPYTRFQSTINDPRTKDPSNGGTSPQNYVNIASSCTDTAAPSVYYALHQGAASDGSEDVILFRWRVEQIANTYATGPNAGSFGSSHPWNSALWTVLFDIDGDGYRDVAAHLDGSSGSPSNPIDILAGIWGQIPTQSIDYADPNISLIGVQQTAFVDRNTDQILNFQNSQTPAASWPNGNAETIWDHGSTRAVKISTRPCNEYFIDYQIPVALLDASSLGGPKVERSTPISMLFCTANSLNNPFQKDCALNRPWTADPTKPAPFGDYISFELTEPYRQPIVRQLTVEAPQSCSAGTELLANIQDSLVLNNAGEVETSVKAASFWYYFDANGDGAANDSGGVWLKATDATPVPGSLGQWSGNWDTSTLPKGRYLVGVQAVDDRTKVDDGGVAAAKDHRTFSYVTSNAQGELYINGAWVNFNNASLEASFPTHGPSQLTPSATEDWFGNPAITGATIATVGVDVALNNCGVAPTITKTVSPAEAAPGDTVTYTVNISNPAGNPNAITVSEFEDTLPAGFGYVLGSSAGTTSTDPTVVSQTLTWTLATSVSIAPGASASLSFDATVSSTAGTYNNTASATTSFGEIASEPVAVVVDQPRVSLTKTPSRYLASPGSELTYTLAWENASSFVLSNATLTDTLPSDVTFAGCSDGCSQSGSSITWNIGELAAGATGSVTLTVKIESTFSATSLTNTAALSAEKTGDTVGSPSINESASSTIVVANAPSAPAFSFEKTASDLSIAPSANVTYTLAYENFGQAAASDVEIIDTLPEGMTFVSCDATTSSTHFDQCVHSGGEITFSHSSGTASVPAGDSGSVSLVATAAAPPFTFPNPTVNGAELTWTGGSIQDTKSVGISGDEFCEAVFYFSRTDPSDDNTNIVTSTPPSSNTDIIESFNGTARTISFTTQTNSDITLAGRSLSIDFFVASDTGSPSYTAALFVGSSTTPLLTASEKPGNTGLNSPTLFTTSAAFNATQTPIPANTTLRWDFTLDPGSKTVNFHFGSQTRNSRSSFCVDTPPPVPALKKTVDKPRVNVSPVEKITYTLEYANLGDSATPSMTLVDPLPAGLTNCEASTDGTNWISCNGSNQHTFSLGVIASSTSDEVYIRGDSPSGATEGDVLQSTATLSGTGVSSVQSSAKTVVGDPKVVTGGGAPELRVSKSANKRAIAPGETVTYEVVVVNTGAGAASNITVTDTIPAQTYYAYVGGSIAGGNTRSVSGSSLSWTITSLGIGEAVTLSYQMKAASAGVPAGVTVLNNTAILSDATECTAPTEDFCTSNEVGVSINGNPSLGLTKTASATTGLKPKDNITWTLALTNTGSATAVAPRIVDPIPSNTNFVSASGGGVLDVLNNQVIWNLPDLAPGASTSVTLTAKIRRLAPGQNQAIPNQATASATNASPVTASVQSSASAAPVLSLTKQGPEAIPLPAAIVTEASTQSTELRVDQGRLIDAGQFIEVGGTTAKVLKRRGPLLILDSSISASAGDVVIPSVTWSLAWENSGDATASSVTLTDALPAGWTFVEASATPNGTAAQTNSNNTIVTWSLASIEPDARGSVTVTAIPATTGEFTNTASLSDALYCTGGTPPSTCSANALVRVGGLKITKFTSTPIVKAGETASYTVLVENTLNVGLTDIVIDGVLTEGFVYKAGTAEIDGVATEPNISNGRPVWSGLSLSPNGELTIAFDVDVSPDTAVGTYDSDAVANFVPGSASSAQMARSTPINDAGIAPFDPLSTTQEDVTVLTTQTFLVSGRVFDDQNADGSFDEGEIGFENIRLEIDDSSGVPYEVFTNEFGQFQQIVESAGDWIVTPAGGDNTALLTDYALLQAYSDPTTVSLTAQQPSSSVLLGYFSTNQTQPTYTLNYDANGGTGTPPTSVTSLTIGQSVTVAAATGLTRSGFVFDAWNTAANGSGTSADEADAFVMPGANVTLYAQWTPAPPVAVDDAYQTTAGASVTGTVSTNDTVPTGSTFAIVTSVASGTLDTSNFASNGQFSYTPSAQLTNGTDQFVYEICLPAPNSSICDQATATITVASSTTPVAPVAVNDSYQTTPNTAVSGAVGSNDTYATGSTFAIVTSVTSGTLDTSNFASNGQFSYTPSAQLTNGTDQFVYEICLPAPNSSICDQATATITVTVTETDTTPDSCNDLANISGVVWRDTDGDNVFDQAEEPIKSRLVPMTLIPQGSTLGAQKLQTTIDGAFSFEDIPAGNYLLQVIDTNINLTENLYPSDSSLFFVELKDCDDITHNYGYTEYSGPVVSGQVWYDVDGDGTKSEWFDANDNGAVTLNVLNEVFDYSKWEWLDLNGDNSFSGPENIGELNVCGFGSAISPGNVMVDGPSDDQDRIIVGVTGDWRTRPENGFGDYRAQLLMSDGLNGSAAEVASSGLCKPLSTANTSAAKARAVTARNGGLVCGGSGPQARTLTQTNNVADDLDFAMVCVASGTEFEFVSDISIDDESNADLSNLAPGSLVDLSALPVTPRPGYRLVGWNTAIDGSGDGYPLDGVLSMPAGDLTLFAQWVLIEEAATDDPSPVPIPTLSPWALALLLISLLAFHGWRTKATRLGAGH